MRLLVFQHVPHEHPGYVSEYAKESNIELDIIELWKPYIIPDTSGYDGLIIMGGPMGVYENYPSEQDELTVIKSLLGTMPMLGLCLGGQLIAHALGGKVHPNIINGKLTKEVGYYSIDLSVDGKKDPLFRNFSSSIDALEWHGDAFELPEGARLLASTPLCSNQAFVYKNAYGLLFHFEFMPEMVKKQIEIDRAWIHKDNEVDESRLVTEAEEYASRMKQQCYRLLDNFTALMKIAPSR